MYRSFINAARNQEDAGVGGQWRISRILRRTNSQMYFFMLPEKKKGTFKGRGEEN
jgi:hypothetical protein